MVTTSLPRLALVAALTVAAAPAPAGAWIPAPAHACGAKSALQLSSTRRTWVAIANGPVAARARPGGPVIARFGALNANGYPTLFAVRGRVLNSSCRASWYLVQLPVRPNGRSGWVPARRVHVASLTTRIVVDVSARSLRLFEGGRLRLQTRVAVGSRDTPTPTGRFYVNQRLVPVRTDGPYGPAALGLSAFSEVLTDWPQGGPIAIHGTDDPASIGRRVSDGCIRVSNRTLWRLFRATPAGTPVTIHL